MPLRSVGTQLRDQHKNGYYDGEEQENICMDSKIGPLPLTFHVLNLSELEQDHYFLSYPDTKALESRTGKTDSSVYDRSFRGYSSNNNVAIAGEENKEMKNENEKFPKKKRKKCKTKGRRRRRL